MVITYLHFYIKIVILAELSQKTFHKEQLNLTKSEGYTNKIVLFSIKVS